jgi:hypothetical protein
VRLCASSFADQFGIDIVIGIVPNRLSDGSLAFNQKSSLFDRIVTSTSVPSGTSSFFQWLDPAVVNLLLEFFLAGNLRLGFASQHAFSVNFV